MCEGMKKVATVSKAGVSGTDREPANAVNESNREGCVIFDPIATPLY